MAFGSFFKKIISGAKNLIGKVVPIVKKGLNAVSKIAPAIATGAAALGGPIGATIGSVASTVGNIAGGLSNFMDKSRGRSPPTKALRCKATKWRERSSWGRYKSLTSKWSELVCVSMIEINLRI